MRAGLLSVAALGACAAPAQPVAITDDRGVRLALAAPAGRLVALAPHATELAFAAGAGERLVGAVRFSDFPAAARALPGVGDAARIDLERALALRPDLAIGWKSGNQPGDIEKLEKLGIPVFVTEPERLADIPRLLRAIGELAGTRARAHGAARDFELGLADLAREFAGLAPVRVFYEIWHRPLITVNGRHMISDVIRLCGGRNVFAGAPALAPVVSLEAVIAARPQVILGGSSATTRDEFLAAWRRERRIPALRDVAVRYVPADEIQRQSPRILEGARAICNHLAEARRPETAHEALINLDGDTAGKPR